MRIAALVLLLLALSAPAAPAPFPRNPKPATVAQHAQRLRELGVLWEQRLIRGRPVIAYCFRRGALIIERKHPVGQGGLVAALAEAIKEVGYYPPPRSDDFYPPGQHRRYLK
jgi:hypothetical protein